MQNLLFYAHTRGMYYVTKTFLLVSSSVRSKQLLCSERDRPVLARFFKTFPIFKITLLLSELKMKYDLSGARLNNGITRVCFLSLSFSSLMDSVYLSAPAGLWPKSPRYHIGPA